MLTQRKCSGSTPCPLSMNQLNHSTEKLTQTHRHPSNPQKVTGRCTPGAEAAGHRHPHPSPGGPAPASPRRTLVLANPGSPRLPGGSILPASLCLPSVGKHSLRPNSSCLVSSSWIYLSSFNCALTMFKVWLGQREAQNDQYRNFVLEELRVHGTGRGGVRYLGKCAGGCLGNRL